MHSFDAYIYDLSNSFPFIPTLLSNIISISQSLITCFLTFASKLNPLILTSLAMIMKRDREDEQTLDLVSCLMLLSKDGQNDSFPVKKQKTTSDHMHAFVCKTCNREFSSFQALGGHRASHNKSKLMANGATDLLQLAQSTPSSPVKPKTHECPICGLEFALGQALGGHMRRHRDVMSSSAAAADRARAAVVPVLKKSNSSKRVSCLNLDLNLAPPGYQRHYDLTNLQLIV